MILIGFWLLKKWWMKFWVRVQQKKIINQRNYKNKIKILKINKKKIKLKLIKNWITGNNNKFK